MTGFYTSVRIYLFMFTAVAILLLVKYFLYKWEDGSKPHHDDNLYDEQMLRSCYYRALRNTILVLNFNFPFYHNVNLLKDLYDGVFDHVITCGPAPKAYITTQKPDIVFTEEGGTFGYHCLALAVEKYPGYKGYFYGNDDMIINWWTMVNRDKSKIWHGTKVVDWRQEAFGEIVTKNWIWWETPMGIGACQKYYNTIKNLAASSANNNSILNAMSALKIYLQNGNGRPRCGKGWSDFFYIPGHLSKQYAALSHVAYKNKLYLEIAVHNILRTLDRIENLEVINGIYLPDLGLEDYSAQKFWKIYNHRVAFIHPFKFHADDNYFSRSSLTLRVIRFKQTLTDC